MLGNRKVITIDGLAATGKSSLAQALATKLNYTIFTSGLLYRLLGFAAKRSGINLDKEADLLSHFEKQKFEIALVGGKNRALLNSEDVTQDLFSTEISEASSRISVHPAVRNMLLNLQREVFPGKNIVAEGRDMGTVVFPEADLKFFIEVKPEMRIKRRLDQIRKGRTLPDEELKLLKEKMEIEVTERDIRDTERSVSPTIPAADAIIIDNGAETLTEVVEKMYDFCAKRKQLL